MRLGIARTAVAVASSAGLVVGMATSAGAAGFDRDRDRHRGWVNICQDINEHHGSQGKKRDRDRPRYHGAYKVEDSSYRAKYVDLYGRYDCDQVQVRAGRVHVSVTYVPEHTRLRSRYDKWVYVDRGEYKRVVFNYDARGRDKDGHSRAA
jgi:hypothetical protein